MGVQNLLRGVIVMDREELIAMVKDAAVQNRHVPGAGYSGPQFGRSCMCRAMEYSGYRARIYDIKSY